ncbi:tetratricopeptide repeat protein [Candidatus Leptofilum sp.]|uniref:tetratricopeptide repeat protein n=1 Tax=Candidatus Leptofilum sp. TaxID=3241576 RepID=UPI003B592BE0
MSDVDDFLLDEFKDRELEILSLMADGLTNAAIGEKLFITKETVRWYNKQIYSKLGTSRRTEAIAKAQRLGLIRSGETAVSTPTAQPHNLPTIATPFMGRDKEIKRITTILGQPNTPLLTVLGPGGMGKTRLAIETGHQLLETYPDGVYLFELAPLNHANNIITVALQALGINAKGTDDQKQQLFDACRDKKMVLIFDNFEHILDGADLVDGLMKAAPTCRILVTSRERLNLYGETVLELKGLKENGSQLFEAVARTLKATFVLNAPDIAHVQQIVNLVGGLPLGIILAASWVDSLDVDEIAEEIRQDLDILSTEMRNIPERQQSIRTVLSASWEKLSRQEQRACMKLAIFRGGFRRKAAKAVAGASIRLLQSLQHKSFVQQVAERRYDLHPLVQQFAFEKLKDSGHLQEAKADHLAYFAAYVTDTLVALEHGDYLYPLREVELEKENVAVALDWGLGQQDEIWETAVTLTAAMSDYWYSKSYFNEGILYCSRALAHLPLSPVWAKLIRRKNYFLLQLGEIEQAAELAEQLFDFAETQEDVQLKLSAYGTVTTSLLDINDYEKTVELADQYWALSQSVAHPGHMFLALNRLGDAHRLLGNNEKAIEIARKAVNMTRQQENDALLASATYNLGLMLMELGHLEEPRALFEESLALKRLIGERAGIARRLYVLSQLSCSAQMFAEAEIYLTEADQIIGDLNAPKRTMEHYFYGWAFYYEMQSDWAQAIRYTKEALQIATQFNYTGHRAAQNLMLARVYAKAGLPQQAKIYLERGADHSLQPDTPSRFNTDCLLAFSRYWLTVIDLTKCATAFIYFGDSYKGDPYIKHEVEQIQTALDAHFSTAEFEALKASLPESDPKQVIAQQLAELQGHK